jgi:magnesium-transporting ATPase (P-type)
LYQGPSPDEISLVEAAREMNFEFMHSTQQTTSVKVLGREQKFELLGVFPFTSDRKRMSVVVREEEK